MNLPADQMPDDDASGCNPQGIEILVEHPPSAGRHPLSFDDRDQAIEVLFEELQSSETERSEMWREISMYTHDLQAALKEREAAYRQLDRYVQDLHQLLRERNVALEGAKAATRLKSQILGNVSHEFRTPINVVVGFTEVMLRQTQAPELADYLKRLMAAGHRLHRLVENMLTLVRLEIGQENATGTAHVDALLQDIVSRSQNGAAKKGMSLHLLMPTTIPLPAPVDPQRLAFSVDNLLDNAIKFSGSGQVTVELTLDEATSLPRRIDIRDLGIGFDVTQFDELASPFMQANLTDIRPYDGAGLGLPVAKALIESMGCTLHAVSQPGVGSCFSIVFPGIVEPAREEIR